MAILSVFNDGKENTGDSDRDKIDKNIQQKQGAVAEPKSIADYKFRDNEMLSSCGARLLFEGGVPWMDWETASVAELKKALGEDNTWSDGDLLRYVHLAVSYRYGCVSGQDYIPEDVVSAKELLEKSRAWKDENRPLGLLTFARRLQKWFSTKGVTSVAALSLLSALLERPWITISMAKT